MTIVALFLSDLTQPPALFADRSFFGTHLVRDSSSSDVRLYKNGSTIHGTQRLADLTSQQPTPISYYFAEGPIGEVVRASAEDARVGVVGLGAGAMACHAKPGQDWHFYEIDPVVDRVARDPALFTYLSACAPDAPTHLGDARQVLEDQSNMNFDVLVLDAYSSDAVPIHLTTVEATELYLDHLAQDGLLLFHISNRYFAIERPLGRAAEALGLKAWIKRYRPEEADREGGALDTVVVLYARDATAAEEIIDGEEWQELSSDGEAVWTDDRANALSILR